MHTNCRRNRRNQSPKCIHKGVTFQERKPTWASVSPFDSLDFTTSSYCCLIRLWIALPDEVKGYRQISSSLSWELESRPNSDFSTSFSSNSPILCSSSPSKPDFLLFFFALFFFLCPRSWPGSWSPHRPSDSDGASRRAGVLTSLAAGSDTDLAAVLVSLLKREMERKRRERVRKIVDG